MEWVDGEPLGFLLSRAAERGGVPMGVAAALVSQVLAGLHAAHELSDHSGPLGVVHRDVSPHNILVTYDGVAKLLDFGIAKATHQASGNTETGEVKGKFSYMAPEQILGGQVDRRCDIFAAGIILYFLSTGKHPFKHANTAAVIHSITTDDPVPPPSTLVADYPEELEQIVLKALEKDADKRWNSAEEMRIALERALPDAFDEAGEAALREFMERTVGDRKLARREAVRRAQLAADARDVETGARKALQSPAAQSASSLRAISISQPVPGDMVDIVGEDSSERRHTEPAPAPRRRSAKGPFIAAMLGLLLAGAVTLPRLLRHEAGPVPEVAQSLGQNGSVAAAPPAMSALPEVAPPVVAPPVVAPPVAAAAPPSASATPSSAEPARVSGSAPVPRVPATHAKRKAVAPSKKEPVAPTGREDLLAPDYAR